MKVKKISGKLMLNKTTVQNLDNDTMDMVKAGYVLDSRYICTVAGTDCYCVTRPPACTDKIACWY